jgi:hypothetical protein
MTALVYSEHLALPPRSPVRYCPSAIVASTADCARPEASSAALQQLWCVGQDCARLSSTHHVYRRVPPLCAAAFRCYLEAIRGTYHSFM